jgi:hypothetical protein
MLDAICPQESGPQGSLRISRTAFTGPPTSGESYTDANDGLYESPSAASRKLGWFRRYCFLRSLEVQHLAPLRMVGKLNRGHRVRSGEG